MHRFRRSSNAKAAPPPSPRGSSGSRGDSSPGGMLPSGRRRTAPEQQRRPSSAVSAAEFVGHTRRNTESATPGSSSSLRSPWDAAGPPPDAPDMGGAARAAAAFHRRPVVRDPLVEATLELLFGSGSVAEVVGVVMAMGEDGEVVAGRGRRVRAEEERIAFSLAEKALGLTETKTSVVKKRVREYVNSIGGIGAGIEKAGGSGGGAGGVGVGGSGGGGSAGGEDKSEAAGGAGKAPRGAGDARRFEEQMERPGFSRRTDRFAKPASSTISSVTHPGDTPAAAAAGAGAGVGAGAGAGAGTGAGGAMGGVGASAGASPPFGAAGATGGFGGGSSRRESLVSVVSRGERDPSTFSASGSSHAERRDSEFSARGARSVAGSEASGESAGVQASEDAEEIKKARHARLAERALWLVGEMRKVGLDLDADSIDEAAALLTLLNEASASALAGITAVYNLRGTGERLAKGEAAVVWRADAKIEKTIKQFLRVCEKLSMGLEDVDDAEERDTGESASGVRRPSVEIVANAYEATRGGAGPHANARVTLSMVLILLGIIMRVGQREELCVWLQPVDIHAPTPTECVREWDPRIHSVIMSVKGPWPWGDNIRASVTSSERKELALSLANGGNLGISGEEEAPVIGLLEEQASELLEQKREKHAFLIGTTGAGKSTLGNLLAGQSVFHVDPTKTGTLYPQPFFTTWGLEKQVLWDTPGLSDGKNRDELFLSELALVVDRVQLAAAVILVIRSPARIPGSLVQALESYKQLFGNSLAKVLYVVVNDSSRVYPPDEIDMYNATIAEQLIDELDLDMKPGFLLQIPTNRPDVPLPPDVIQLQRYNIEWLKQAVIGSRPVLTRTGHQTIESLLALRTTLDSKQKEFYRLELLRQSGRQREGLQLLLSRADVRKAFFSKRGYVLIQTWDLSTSSRVLQVLQGIDSRLQQKRELRITPDSPDIGAEIANGLQLRKRHYSSRKEVRATTPDDVFSVLNDLGLVLIPLTVPTFSDGGATRSLMGESYAAARPGDRVSQRTLQAIADVLTDTTTSESVVRLVQSCLAEYQE